MATTVDALIITLGIDASQFSEGQRAALEAFKRTQEAAVQGGKNIEAQGKKATEYLSNLKREALTLLAVVAGGKGIIDMTNHVVNMDAAVSRLARTTGTVAANLAKWQIAVREVGGTNEDAQSAIRSISRSISESGVSQDWNAQTIALFSRLHLDRADWGNPDKVLTAFGQFAQQPEFKGHADQLAPWAFRLPGMTEGLFNLFAHPEFGRLMSQAEHMTPAGGGLGPESEKFQESMALFSTAVDNFYRAVLDWGGVPILDSLRKLFGVIEDPKGTEATELHKEASKKSFGGVANAFANWVDYTMWGLPTPDRDAAGPKSSAKPATAAAGGRRGSNAFAPGEVINDVQVYSDYVGGARGAAATSTVNNRSSRSNSKTDVHIENINLPGVKDAKQFVGSLDDVLSLQSHGAAVNGGLQ